MVRSPNHALQSHKVSGDSPKLTKGQGRWAKKSEKSRKSGKVKPGRGGGYWGGRPLGDMSTYLRQHRWDITQTFMVDGRALARTGAERGRTTIEPRGHKSSQSHETNNQLGPIMKT